MMPRTNSDAKTVEQGAEVHGMNVSDVKTNDGIFGRRSAINPQLVNLLQLVGGIGSEFLFVLRNVLHA